MRRVLLILLSLLLVASCRTLPFGPTETAIAPDLATDGRSEERSMVLSGRALFAERAGQATMDEVAAAATVSLINTGTNQTEASTVTRPNGRFDLSLPRGFRPESTATYYLEASKGLGGNKPGNDVARIRTIARYAEGWISLSNTVPNEGIVISPTSTAIAVGAALRAGTAKPVAFADLLGTLSEATYTPVTNLSGADVTAILAIVNACLAANRDPIDAVGLDTATDTWKKVNQGDIVLAATSLAPTSGNIGSTVTVTGKGFSQTPSNNVVRFNGEPSAASARTETTLTVTVPAGATSGQTSVQVGNLIALGPNFTVPLNLASYAPTSGDPGTSVTITGSGFDPEVLANNAVTFNGTTATVTAVTASTLTATVPNGAISGNLVVKVAGLSKTAGTFTVPVKITGLSASAGKPGDTVTITGSGFGTAVQNTIKFNGTTVSALSTSPTSLSVKLPSSLPTGAGPVTVTTAGQTGSSAGDFTVFNGLPANATIQSIAGASLPEAGRLATNWSLDTLAGGLARDSLGNLYVASSNHNAVYKVTPGGVISVLAGTRVGGLSGDGGQAASAQVSGPQGLAVDAADNLYIADFQNRRIRMVALSTGNISTVAGPTGLGNVTNVAVGPGGILYVTDGTHTVKKIEGGIITVVAGTGTSGNGGENVPAASTALSSPTGVAVDAAGNLYIAEYMGHRVRKVDAATGNMVTIAGNGTGGNADGTIANSRLWNPRDVSVNGSGDVYIADSFNNRIRKVSGGTVSTVAGSGASLGDGGSATSAKLQSPNVILATGASDFYLIDSSQYRVRRVTSGTISTVASNGSSNFSGDGGSALSAQFDTSSGIAVDASGDVYFTDTGNHRIRKVSGGLITTVVGNGTSGSGTGAPLGATLSQPSGIAVDAAGTLYIADTNNHRVLKLSGGTLSVVAGTGSSGTGADTLALNTPRAVAVDSAGTVYIADTYNHRIVQVSGGTLTRIAGTGSSTGAGANGPALTSALYAPSGVAVDGLGNVYITEYDGQRLRKLSGGTLSTLVGSGLSWPYGLTVDNNGFIYVVEGDRVRKVDQTNTVTTVAGSGSGGFSGDGGLATSAKLYGPRDVAINAAGTVLYIMDTSNKRIRKVQ
ncbi:IPT/TIG domain-containing protein [bacterium]|nr:IPT/TIG domain-containing protein [bacterium]